MQEKIFEIINKYVSDWNLLKIPVEIANYEYTDFVPLIKDVLKGKTGSLDKVDNYISDLIGIGFENNDVLNDFNKILKSIRDELIINHIKLWLPIESNVIELQGLEITGQWKGIPHFKIGNVHIPIQKELNGVLKFWKSYLKLKQK